MANLVFQANVRDLAIAGLTQKLSGINAQAQQDVYNTLAAQRDMMANFGMFVHDSDKVLSTHQYTFSGLAEVQEQFMYCVAGAAEMPVTKIFGRSAAGLDATGEMDMQQYYDNIAEKQEAYLRPAVLSVLPVIAVSEWGRVPDDLGFEFEPVQEVSEKERADLAGQTTTSVIAGYNAGLTSRKLSLMELREQSKATGLWTNITDEMIDAASGDIQAAGEATPDLGMLAGLGQETARGTEQAGTEAPRPEPPPIGQPG